MLLITGSLAFDNIMDFPGHFSDHIMPEKIHMLNISFLVEEMRRGFGGTAGNIAYTLSLLGIKCVVMGIAGEDFVSYKEFLEKNEIDVTLVKMVSNLYTSTAFGITDSHDNQIWGFYSGADTLSDQLSVLDINAQIDFGVIAPHNPRAMIKFAREYQRMKIPYLFDPGMQLPWLNSADLIDAFKGAKIIIGNDYEMSLMEKKTGIAHLEKLSNENKIIITTLGEKGSRIAADGQVFPIPPAVVKHASDPTGAGDAFRSGFMAGFMRELPLSVCGRMGSIAAAYTVEKYGTTTHTFTIGKFIKRYKENFGEEIKL